MKGSFEGLDSTTGDSFTRIRERRNIGWSDIIEENESSNSRVNTSTKSNTSSVKTTNRKVSEPSNVITSEMKQEFDDEYNDFNSFEDEFSEDATIKQRRRR